MNVHIWSNILLVHLWAVAYYIKPGWAPAAVCAVQIVILVAMLRDMSRSKS